MQDEIFKFNQTSYHFANEAPVGISLYFFKVIYKHFSIKFLNMMKIKKITLEKKKVTILKLAMKTNL